MSDHKIAQKGQWNLFIVLLLIFIGMSLILGSKVNATKRFDDFKSSHPIETPSTLP